MSTAGTRTRWIVETLLFLLTGFVALGLPMIPMGTSPGSIGFPDLLFCVLVAWFVRRPRFAWLVLVVFLGLLGDALLLRPLGLWAAILVLVAEIVRSNHRVFLEAPFVVEWLYAGAILALALLVQNVVMFVAFAGTYDAATVALHGVRTFATYPLVVLVLQVLLRVRRSESATQAREQVA